MDVLEHLMKLGDQVMDRQNLLSLLQEIAEHFYPERADFTATRTLGEDYGANLMSSYPVLVRRDLGDSLSSILRPTNKEWYHQRPVASGPKAKIAFSDGIDVDQEGMAWLERSDHIMRRAMYHKDSGFSRATKEADHDFAAFGQAVIQVTLNRDANGLLFRNWHLRDVGWMENENGVVDTVVRNWRPTAYRLSQLFPRKSLAPQMVEKLDKSPFMHVNVRHMIVPSTLCKFTREYRTPFVSVYIDIDNKHIIEERPSKSRQYVIPRWRTVSGTQYAVSPATCVALPDARLLQAMVGLLLEATEKAVSPPTVANKEIFGGNFAMYAGGMTWADMADGRIQDHFQQIPIDKNGIPLGLERERNVNAQLLEAFYINKLSLPPAGAQMTAYEVGQRVQEYIRQAMPLFEPMEYEYNAPLCEATWDVLFGMGAFGSPHDIPKSLRGRATEFMFESPLHDAIERARGQQFLETKAMLAEAVSVDPSAIHVVDIKAAFRDALRGSGAPASWVRSESDAQALADAEAQNQRTAEMLQQMQMGADIAKTTGEAQQLAGTAPTGA